MEIMKRNKKGTFLSINPNSKIFEMIKIQQPKWWNLFFKDDDLYIEIRKDNYINVYYYGGSLAKIEYLDNFVASTHQKYLGHKIPLRKKSNVKGAFIYELLDLETLDKIKISEIKNRIKNDYLQKINAEKPAEKWIQGKLIKENQNYIDSEFQFNQDQDIGKLRIDLVELSNNILSFIELKGIFDNRLINDEKRNQKTPEIIEQMNKYKLFIHKYEENIIEYYQKLIEIKNSLGLTSIDKTKIRLNKNPKLIIANTYNKKTKKRDERICDIENLLKKNDIDYKIIKL